MEKVVEYFEETERSKTVQSTKHRMKFYAGDEKEQKKQEKN